jgi:spermidine/putrescine transport system permease protein
VSAVAHIPGGDTSAPPPMPRRRNSVPYLLLLPGVAWLIIFFVVPMLFLASQSLQTGSLEEGYRLTWHFATYKDALSTFHSQMIRSFVYAATATALALLIGYPLAYTIAFKAGRWRNILLVLVIAPFFTSFLIRTLAWKVILSDNGWLVTTLNGLHVPLPDDRLLATAPAVIAGLVYNFLPFMVLPLYASLEKLDPRLLEAAGDLYARPVARFTRVALPLSMPGVVAGTLLTFIPAAGDYINAQLLGTNRQYMIGNVIQSKFLRVGDYPSAAALSFTLMAAILVLVFVYVRRAGTDEVL